MKTYYEKDPAMVAREIAGELILVPIRQNVSDLRCMYTLNTVASRIWQLIEDHVTAKDIVSVLTKEYEVEAPQAEADVLDFLSQMKSIGAVVEKNGRG